MVVGAVMTTITSNISIPQLWLGMFIAGVGIATLRLHDHRANRALLEARRATSNLILPPDRVCRLAISGTLFANALASELPKKLAP